MEISIRQWKWVSQRLGRTFAVVASHVIQITSENGQQTQSKTHNPRRNAQHPYPLIEDITVHMNVGGTVTVRNMVIWHGNGNMAT